MSLLSKMSLFCRFFHFCRFCRKCHFCHFCHFFRNDKNDMSLLSLLKKNSGWSKKTTYTFPHTRRNRPHFEIHVETDLILRTQKSPNEINRTGIGLFSVSYCCLLLCLLIMTLLTQYLVAIDLNIHPLYTFIPSSKTFVWINYWIYVISLHISLKESI